jgi:hypothetical protein
VLSHSATHCARRAATLNWPPKASIGGKLRETGGGHRHGESLQPLLCANCAPPASVLWRSTLAADQRTWSKVVDRPPSRGRPVHSLSQVVQVRCGTPPTGTSTLVVYTAVSIQCECRLPAWAHLFGLRACAHWASSPVRIIYSPRLAECHGPLYLKPAPTAPSGELALTLNEAVWTGRSACSLGEPESWPANR